MILVGRTYHLWVLIIIRRQISIDLQKGELLFIMPMLRLQIARQAELQCFQENIHPSMEFLQLGNLKEEIKKQENLFQLKTRKK